ncbi:MAG: manganese/zinc/iron transport system binding protein [Thermomicrobiales bacterium]|jgi:ABC-type Mn2+/Zn2+ transport system ATPase subunit|nr:manganese/zinc/iron transport system binding protein [Thermomicrobiales bacterium]
MDGAVISQPVMNNEARLVVEGLGVHFADRSALEGISVSFGAGESVSLLGPNGAGKSTLLKVIAGVLPATHGSVRLAGRPIDGTNPAVVYVPQRSSVDWTFPVSVLDVVLMARAQRRSRFGPFRGEDRERALAALDQVGMRPFAPVQIGQLSGGQQQRVFLARALLQDGDVYLLDEPFTGVDVPTQELVVSLFDQLRRTGRTIIYATHDLAQAAKSSDRIFLLNRRLIASGPPSETMTAANLRAAFGGQAIVPLDGGMFGMGEAP